MKKLLYKIFVFLNAIVVLALILSYISIYISPEKAWFLTFLGLGFPYIAISNILFAIYWMFRRKKIYLLSLIALISGSGYLNDFVQININSDSKAMSSKILSYNVRVFDLYSWSKEMEAKNNIFKTIEKEKANIICFQEFFDDKTDEFIIFDTIPKIFKTNYYHDAYTKNVGKRYSFGIVTFSSYPIINKGEIRFKNTNNICIYSDIKIEDDTIRVYNNHLQSVHFIKDEYELLDSIQNIDKTKVKQVKGILSKIKHASIIRAQQVDIISNHIKTSPYPVFVCGDFNDTPVSYTYKRMSDGLKDAFAESGNGIGSTYNGKIPFLRIDYLLHSSEIQSCDFSIIKCDYSDHYPITCKFIVGN